MLKRYLVLGLLLSLAGSAFASDMKDLAAIDRALNALFDLTSGVASKSPLLEDGRRLFGYLLVILIAWSGIQVLLEGGGALRLLSASWSKSPWLLGSVAS